MKRIKNSSVEKTKALFKQLLLNPNFLKDIKQFRMTHKIPLHGFKTFDDYAKWDKEYKSNEIRVPILQEHVYTNGDGEKPVITRKKVKYVITTYWFGLCKILKRYDLSLEWNVYIDDYICFNRKQIKVNPFIISLDRDIYNDIILGEEISIKMGATIPSDYFLNSVQEYTRWKNYIEPLQKLMQGYKEKSLRPSRTKFSLQSVVYKNFKKGLSDKQIYDKFPKIENVATIRQLRHRFKKKISPDD